MPRVKFTKKDILKATYDIMKQDGIQNISARKIANKFKGSTAPIYANFSTIEEENGDIKKAEELCRHLFYIAELYEKYSDAEMIKAYHERVFNPKEAWYFTGV